MRYDKEILSATLRSLEQERTARERELEMRRQEIYSVIPRIRQIDDVLRHTAASVLRAALESGDDPSAAIAQLQRQNLKLQQERTSLLLQHQYPGNYLDLQPACPACSDLGYIGTTPCECLKARYTRKLTEQLSTIMPIREHNFSSFRLDYYSTQPDSRIGLSARDNMEDNLAACREYTRDFGAQARYLLLYGAPGLGKSFLSSCIAAEVSKQGFSVAYNTAVAIFSQYEAAKFGGADAVNAAKQIQKYEHVDLLIIDDLGAELTTSFTTSAFYTVLNNRLLTHRSMIINTNLTPADIQRRYSAAIASRILGDFSQLRFFGEDIRLIKRRNIGY